MDLIKQQAHNADLKAIQQINFTENLDRVGNTKRCKTILDCSQEIVTVL